MGSNNLNRRELLRQSALAAAALTGGLGLKNSYGQAKTSTYEGKKVIVIGIDGMDPRLSERMMTAGELPNFAKLSNIGGFQSLASSIPPQSPVAWANFINGAGPGSHGIFDFIHRDPKKQCEPYFAMAQTLAGQGYWELGDHKLQLNFWPFNHKPSATILQRQGVPFWNYLDEAGIKSVFYNLPSNYPASPSKFGKHKCLSGMGTPDMLGTYGTYQYYSENGPVRTKEEGGGMRSMLFFENEAAYAHLRGPMNTFLQEPKPSSIKFSVYRDKQAKAALIEIQEHKILLKKGQWSQWAKLDFEMSMPALMPDEHVSGICRFYLQDIEPDFKLYVTPINTDPSNPAMKLTEPEGFIEQISKELDLFYTTGFQEDHKALSNGIFSDSEYLNQANIVLQERLNLLKYAMNNYEDGLLFFYFSSTDLQSHMFWWDCTEEHPMRSSSEARKYFGHIQELYRKMDSVVGDVLDRYGDEATIIVMSDHGFANFKRQFNLNSWLRENGYIQSLQSTSLFKDVDWSSTTAFGLGINGLYLNLKGRERDGTIELGQESEKLLDELVSKLEAIRDVNGQRVIRKVHRTDKVYSGPATATAPDLVIGYCRGYRASWHTCLGDMTNEILFDNDSTWCADHCADVSEVPGILFSNKPISSKNPRLIDLAPSILSEFGLKTPSSMEGNNIFL